MNEQPTSQADRYKREITLYDKEFSKWEKRARKIIKRYKDERGDAEKAVRYNILYANVQTIKPAIFSQAPKANIERRFKDDDDLGRVTSDVLERCVSYFINSEKFESAVNQAVLDRLLPGRGTVWVRYEPHFKDAEMNETPKTAMDGLQVTDDENTDDEGVSPEKIQEVSYEEVVFDYVHYTDYGHNIARTYEEVWLQWRAVYLDKDELIARFGKEVAEAIPLDCKPKENSTDDQLANVMSKATIYELWDSKRRVILWIHKEVDKILDEKEDPLALPDFFCGSKPLFANLANDTLIPTPDFAIYQDQARELDNLTARIAALTKALKVAGVYDAAAPGIEKMLIEGTENKLIPVEVNAMLKEKGGLKGVIDYFPVEQVANVLVGLYEARGKVIQDIYQITGISDIIRGATDAGETASAQKIKGQYASIRLDSQQKDIQYFCRDLVRICAFIIAGHFSIDTIKKISGVKLLTGEEKQMMQMQMQQAQQQYQGMQQQAQANGQQPPPPPPEPDDKTKELLKNPTWEEVEALLKNEPALCFKVDIETDSTIKADQEAEKHARMEFITASGTFLQQMATIQDPKLAALAGELLMFGVRAFKSAREMESTMQLYIDDMQQKAQQPQQQPPNPEMMAEESRAKTEQAKIQSNEKIEDQKLQAETTKAIKQAELDTQLQREQMAADVRKSEIEAQRDVEIARQKMEIEAETSLQIEMIRASVQKQANDAESQRSQAEDMRTESQEGDANIRDTLTPMLETIREMASSKKISLSVKRDEQGNMESVEGSI